MGEINKPEPLNEHHCVTTFRSGEDALDAWLKQRAFDNEHRGASRTFVIHQTMNVIGYYSLAAGSVTTATAPGKIKRNMPNPIPVMILGRLAIDINWHAQGLGRALLKDAVLRTSVVAQNVGIRALLVHAISESAKHFYKRFGFIESPLDPMCLMLCLQ